MTEGSSADHSLSTMTAFGRELVLLHRVFGSENDPRRAVGDLRAVARRDLAPRPLEGGLELGERIGGAVGPHAVVVIEHRAVAGESRLEFAGEIAVLLRRREPLLALGGIFVGLPPRDVKQMPDQLGGLAHIELGDRIGEPALEADHRREERRTTAERRPRVLRRCRARRTVCAYQFTALRLKTSGAWLSDSAPPARRDRTMPSRM